MNERWRVALAGLIAALAIPFLAIDTPESLEGIETAAPDEIAEIASPSNTPAASESGTDDVSAASDQVADAPVEVVVIEQAVSPDISLLAARAGSWGQARSQAIEDGRVEVRPPAPSNSDLSLLPFVPASESSTPEQTQEASESDDNDSDGSAVVEVDDDANLAETTDEAASVDDADAGDEAIDESADPVEDVAELVEEPEIASPTAPAQVDGRVPPPSGGPTAAQWDALRNCESTHNYGAINNTGTYRGAYQFSQQTWDWVAGIHWPHLVGVDPAEAQPAWQDIMAYTLFAMRGWDQWPICGQHLL